LRIDLLPDMPAGVRGIRVSGRLRGDDFRDFEPATDKLLHNGRDQDRGGHRIRLRGLERAKEWAAG
jgi:hypothetical protein